MEIETSERMEESEIGYQWVTVDGKRTQMMVSRIDGKDYIFYVNSVVCDISSGKCVRVTLGGAEEEICLRETDILVKQMSGKYDIYEQVKP